jgi:hypothetical protein
VVYLFFYFLYQKEEVMQVNINKQEMAVELAEIEKQFSERALCVKQKYDRSMSAIQLEKQQAMEVYNLKYMDYEITIMPIVQPPMVVITEVSEVATLVSKPDVSTEKESVRAAWPFPTDRAS